MMRFTRKNEARKTATRRKNKTKKARACVRLDHLAGGVDYYVRPFVRLAGFARPLSSSAVTRGSSVREVNQVYIDRAVKCQQDRRHSGAG